MSWRRKSEGYASLRHPDWVDTITTNRAYRPTYFRGTTPEISKVCSAKQHSKSSATTTEREVLAPYERKASCLGGWYWT